VTDLLTKRLQIADCRSQSVIYACGPKEMLKAISGLAKKHRIPCQVSLEEYIACGIGTCLGCAVKIRGGYKLVCKDGPVFNLKEIFGIKISKGTLVDMLHRTRKYLGREYEAILERIRSSPVKFADETGHRTNGQNGYAWGFFTEQDAYYRIEESRGGIIAKETLEGSHENDVLVRDDYAGYKNLPMKQQSCWAHLLRKSHEAAEEKNASKEMKNLHENLKTMFEELNKILEMPFEKKERQKYYVKYENDIKKITLINY